MEDYLIKNEQEKEQTYQIYEYMKEHNSLLVASLSAMVAVASLISYLLIYVIQCICLNAWNVPVEIIGEVGKGKYFYAIIFGTLFYLIVPIGDKWLRIRFEKVFCLLDYIKLMKRLIRELPKSQKSKERKKYLKKRINKLKMKVNGIKCKLIVIEISILLTFGVIWGISFVIFQLSLARITWKGIGIIGLNTVIVSGLLRFKYKKTYHNDKLPELVKRAQEAETFDTMSELLMEVCDVATNMTGWKDENKKIREHLSDKDIISGLRLVTRSFLTLSSVLLVVSFLTPKFQKEFWIYSDESTGKQYAVIYRDNKQLILDEVTIEGKTISINIEKQLFKTYEDNVFEYIKFDEVKRIGNEI